MKTLVSGVIASVLLASAVSGANAQVIERFFSGCGTWSCHTMHWSVSLHPDYGPFVYYHGDATFFNLPEGIGGALLEAEDQRYDESGAYYGSPPWYGDLLDPEPPKSWSHTVVFGPLGLEYPEGALWSETVDMTALVTTTPEPATLVLLSSGALGLAAMARKRGRGRSRQAD